MHLKKIQNVLLVDGNTFFEILAQQQKNLTILQ